MVTEKTTEDAPWKHFITDNGKFEIKTKDLTLERFQDKLCGKDYKENKEHRWNCIDRWILSHTKPIPRNQAHTRAELLAAADEFKEYLFSKEMWS